MKEEEKEVRLLGLPQRCLWAEKKRGEVPRTKFLKDTSFTLRLGCVFDASDQYA